MKKIMMGLVAAFAFSTFAAPAFAEDKPAAAEGCKKEKKAKKAKKADKKEEAPKAAEGAAK